MPSVYKQKMNVSVSIYLFCLRNHVSIFLLPPMTVSLSKTTSCKDFDTETKLFIDFYSKLTNYVRYER